jgi:23S rRNA (pseudouridine1915-N3)-methyltransferase
MKIAIFAVGRLKTGPEKELAERYFERLSKSAPALGLEFSGVTEVPESRARTAPERRRDEGERLRSQLVAGTALVLLDERGKNLSSDALAGLIGTWRDAGRRGIVFALGGPDGHDQGLVAEADLSLSFGLQTWPHQLARIMLGEQLYRAAAILSGHPYHRA